MTDLNAYYRDWMHVRYPGIEGVPSPADIAPEQTAAHLHRENDSHRGIGERTELRELAAGAVNQDFLEEIGQLTHLEQLELQYPVTATTLAPLAKLTRLRTLNIDSPRAITDFTPILALPKLERLFIGNAKHLGALDWVRPMKDRLRVLGIEGSMYTAQTIPSLAPLEGSAVEALFLTNTRLDDQDLSPIATMPNIRFLGTAINAPRSQFFALRDAKPDLECRWFDEAAWDDFRDPKPVRSRA